MLKISGRCTHGPNPSWTFRVRVRLTWGGLVDSVLEWFSPPLNDHAPVLLQLKQRLPELNHLSEVLHRTCKIKPNQLMYTIYSHESLLSAVHVFFIVFMPKTTEWLFTIADTMLTAHSQSVIQGPRVWKNKQTNIRVCQPWSDGNNNASIADNGVAVIACTDQRSSYWLCLKPHRPRHRQQINRLTWYDGTMVKQMVKQMFAWHGLLALLTI